MKWQSQGLNPGFWTVLLHRIFFSLVGEVKDICQGRDGEAGKASGQARDSRRASGDRFFAGVRSGGASESLNLKGQREGVVVRILQRERENQ